MTVARGERADPAPTALTGFFGKDLIYGLILGGQLLGSVIVTPIITRLLGSAEFGQFAVGIATSQVVWAVADLGLVVSVQLEYAKHGDLAARCRLAHSLVLSSAVVALVTVTTGLWVPALGLAEFAGSIRLGCGLGLMLVLYGGGAALLRSRRSLARFATIATIQMVGGQAAGLAGIFLVGPTAAAYLVGTIVGYAAAAALQLCWCRPVLTSARSHDGVVTGTPLAAALLVSLPLVPQQVAEFAMSTGDRAVVGGLLGSVAVGRYQAAYMIGFLPIAFLIFLNKAWLPRLLAIVDHAERWAALADVERIVVRLLIPGLVGLALTAPLALRLWVPGSFHPDDLAIIVVIVALGALPTARSWTNAQLLISLHRTGWLAVTTGTAALTNLALNFALVPDWHLLGSAAATATSTLLLAVMNTAVVRRQGYRVGSDRLIILAAACCVVACVLIARAPTQPLWLVARTAAAALCAVAMAWNLLRLSARRGEVASVVDNATPSIGTPSRRPDDAVPKGWES